MIEDGFTDVRPVRVRHYAAPLGELSAKKAKCRTRRGESFDVGLSPEELAWVDAQRAKVPSFDDLVRGRA